jgi:hypothetical protein
VKATDFESVVSTNFTTLASFPGRWKVSTAFAESHVPRDLQGADYTNCAVWGNAPFQGVLRRPELGCGPAFG